MAPIKLHVENPTVTSPLNSKNVSFSQESQSIHLKSIEY